MDKYKVVLLAKLIARWKCWIEAQERCITSKETDSAARVTDRISKVTDSAAKVTDSAAKMTDRTNEVTDSAIKVTDRTSKEPDSPQSAG